MKYPFIAGNKLYLRPLEKSDLNENYLKWINCPEVTEYMETGTFPTSMEKLEEYYRKMNTSPNHIILAIVDIGTDYHIGNITLNNINWVNRIANIGIMIGNKDYWGKEYGTEAVKLITRYAFTVLNLHKIWASMYEEHKASVKAFDKAGFSIEGCLKNELYQKGRYHNRIIMSIINESGGSNDGFK